MKFTTPRSWPYILRCGQGSVQPRRYNPQHRVQKRGRLQKESRKDAEWKEKKSKSEWKRSNKIVKEIQTRKEAKCVKDFEGEDRKKWSGRSFSPSLVSCLTLLGHTDKTGQVRTTQSHAHAHTHTYLEIVALAETVVRGNWLSDLWGSARPLHTVPTHRQQQLPVGWCLRCLHSCSQSGRVPWRPATWLTAWRELESNSWMALNSLEEQEQ